MKATTVIAAGLAIVAAWLYVLRRGPAPQITDAGPPAPMVPPPASPSFNPPPRNVW